MVDGLQLFLEDALHRRDVFEGDGALLEVVLFHLCVDNLVHQVADALFRVFGQAARCRFHGVRHHQDGLFLGERVGAGVGEQFFVGLLAGVFVFPRDVEVFRLAAAVVGGDELLDDLGQVVLLRQFQPVRHVADDHLCALLVVEVLVRVDAARLVLGEEYRILHLADVVVQGARTHQLAFGADTVGCFGGKVRHLHGVLERARNCLRHPPQQAVVDVGQLHQRDVRREAEGLFYQEKQRVGEEQQYAVHDEVGVHTAVQFRQVVFRYQLEGKVDGGVGQNHQDGGAEQLRTLRKFPQAEDGGQARRELQQDELVRIAQADGADQHRDHLREEGCPRIEEHADDDRQHGIRDDVYVEDVVRHHHRRHHAVEHDEGEQQRQTAFAVVIVLAEEVEVEHEAEHEDADVEHLPRQHQPLLPDGFATLDGLLAQAFEDVVGLPVHDFAAVDDFLSAQHDAVRPRVVVEDFLPGGFGPQGVVGEVGRQVFVERALPEQVRAVVHGVGGEQVGIRLLHGVERAGVPLVRQFVVYHHDDGCAVLPQPGELFGGEYSRAVDFGEYLLEVAEVVGGGQYAAQVCLVVVPQLLERLLLRVLVQSEVGLEGCHDAVLLSLHHPVVLVDGEVEGRHQLPVFPGLVDVELVVELAVSRHEIDNNPHRAYENKRLIEQVSEREFPVFAFEITHIGRNFCEKYKKKQ